jgi:hypothetical protein
VPAYFVLGTLRNETGQFELAIDLFFSLVASYFIMPLLEFAFQAFRAPSLNLQNENERLASDINAAVARAQELAARGDTW